MQDRTYHAIVAASGVALVALLTTVRFCGDVSLPAKPPRPEVTGGPAGRVLAAAANSTTTWQDLINRDAADAGLPAPTATAMAQAFPYQHDRPNKSLSAGKPEWFESAGLQLRLEKVSSPRGPIVALAVRNPSDVDLAYRIETESSLGDYVCKNIVPIPHDAVVIARHGELKRAECADRPGLTVDVLDVQTVALPALPSLYVGRVPPEALGVEPRFAKAHKTTYERSHPCGVNMPQSVQGALDRGLLGWRDLVDFYARHRCETYRFPLYYRAFERDGERELPAAGAN